jgi:c(7)-type cytochrome triheme protein
MRGGREDAGARHRTAISTQAPRPPIVGAVDLRQRDGHPRMVLCGGDKGRNPMSNLVSTCRRGGTAKAARQVLVAALVLGAAFLGGTTAHAEYGDVVINNYSDGAGMRPAVFPHWFHRIRFACKVCHADLGFKFKAGGNDINMLKIFDGQFCGSCHNGEIAWGVENCVLCHSAKPKTKTTVHQSTLERLVVPPGQ